MVQSKTRGKIAIVDQYEVAADSKRRISLCGARWKHFHVKALSNGAYLLEPRELVSPEAISDKTLRMIEKSAANLKAWKASAPIELDRYLKL
jgi:hypothetical protein